MHLPLRAPGSSREGGSGGPVLGAGWKLVTARLAGGAVLLFGLICGIGELPVHFESSGPAHRADLGIDVRLAAPRSPIRGDIARGLPRAVTAVTERHEFSAGPGVFPEGFPAAAGPAGAGRAALAARCAGGPAFMVVVCLEG
jgi:hypothetical protein